MEIDRRELKSRAREAMKRTTPAFWLAALVYFLLTSGVSSLLDFLPLGFGFLSLFSGILYTLYSLVIDFGFNLWSLWTWRGLNPGLSSLTQGFQIAGRVILMELEIFLRIMGWAVVYSFVCLFPMLLLPILSPFVLLGAVVLSIALQMRYALAPYLLADRPDDGPGAAVRRSVELMRGWKWELFKLYFSFLGWMLLGAVLSWAVEGWLLWHSGFFALAASFDPSTLLNMNMAGLGELQSAFAAVDSAPVTILLSNLLTLPVFLWLTPYRGTAEAGFYEARLQAQQAAAPDLPPL